MLSGICRWCGRVKQPQVDAASSTQVGGTHYLRAIQPWEIIEVWGLDYFRGRALTYLLRAGNKGAAVEDLKKARHLLDYLIEREERDNDG